jgi:hypothetical protein
MYLYFYNMVIIIGVDSGEAAGASAPPIIEEPGQCPTNNPEENFLKY